LVDGVSTIDHVSGCGPEAQNHVWSYAPWVEATALKLPQLAQKVTSIPRSINVEWARPFTRLRGFGLPVDARIGIFWSRFKASIASRASHQG
jgi:hypothetical protein